MFQSIDDVVEHAARRSRELPEIADEMTITRPGCSAPEIARLKAALPVIPGSYVSVIEAIKLDGISIGYFQFWRGYGADRSFVERLIEWNGPDVNPYFEQYRRLGVYEVASWEAEPIAVAYAGSRFPVGAMVKFSACCVDDPPVPLARDFEQLLLFAANLDLLRAKSQEQGNTDADRAIRSFLEYVTAATRPEIIAAWVNIARVVLEP